MKPLLLTLLLALAAASAPAQTTNHSTNSSGARSNITPAHSDEYIAKLVAVDQDKHTVTLAPLTRPDHPYTLWLAPGIQYFKNERPATLADAVPGGVVRYQVKTTRRGPTGGVILLRFLPDWKPGGTM